MIKWATFTFPPLNLWNMCPHYAFWWDINNIKEFYMSDGATEMIKDEYKNNYKPIEWEALDKEVKAWETSTKQVIRDMKKRETFGLQKYGKSLTVDTDEDMLQHLYEELMDGAVYIKTLIEQRKVL